MYPLLNLFLNLVSKSCLPVKPWLPLRIVAVVYSYRRTLCSLHAVRHSLRMPRCLRVAPNHAVARPSRQHPRKRMVRVEGLEPPRLAAPEPKSGASTNSATPAQTYISHARSTAAPTGRPPTACIALGIDNTYKKAMPFFAIFPYALSGKLCPTGKHRARRNTDRNIDKLTR